MNRASCSGVGSPAKQPITASPIWPSDRKLDRHGRSGASCRLGRARLERRAFSEQFAGAHSRGSALGVDIGVERGHRHAELMRRRRARRCPGRPSAPSPRFSFWRVITRGRPPESVPSRARRSEPRHRPPMDQIALELSQGREDPEHQSARRQSSCRYRRSAPLRPTPRFCQITNQSDDVRQRASDPVELPHDEGVAVAGDIERACRARAVRVARPEQMSSKTRSSATLGGDPARRVADRDFAHP